MSQSTPLPRVLRIGPTDHAKAYQAHRSMLYRCDSPKNKSYHRYGGRGITVCDRWRFGEDGKTGFVCFLEDMGDPPTRQHSLDRTNVHGNYEPQNCRWVTMTEQARNKSNSRWLSGFGRTQIMEDWAREFGINTGLFYVRVVKQGLTVEEAVKCRSKVRLSLEKAREIRRLHAEEGIGAQRIAKRFGVSKSTITFVLMGQTWREPQP